MDSVIQLHLNQFWIFCPNGSCFFWTFWNFLGQIIKARKFLYCGFSSGWGAGVIAISLQDSLWSLLDFGMNNVKLLLLSRGHFLCDVMSNLLLNHKYNISPRMVSHENKFNEIKGSTRNLNRIRPYLRFGQTNKTGSLGLRIRNLRALPNITKNQWCLMSSPVHLRLTNYQSFYKIKIGIESKL